MNFDPVVIAIPMYFGLMGLELLVEQFQKTKRYRLNDAITNISCGIGQQAVKIFFQLITVAIYTLIYENLAFFKVENTVLNYIILFFAWDFCYYWAHRMNHEINLFWSGHQVHHQSEDYNLSVALRQSWFQIFFTSFFFWPLALLGFDPSAVVIISGFNLLYQFWIHTEAIGKMGFLEWFMNTPSHHRVHHGRNPKYIDKNHAGTFIIWDRMFGTFQEEEEQPIYGITTPVNTWNPILVNFTHFQVIGKQLKETPGFINKLKVLFYKPGWRPESMGGMQHAPEVDRNQYQKFNTQTPAIVNWYVLFHYVLTLAGSAYFMSQIDKMDWILKGIGVGLTLFAILTPGGLFERKNWVIPIEFSRLLITSLILLFLLYQTPLFVPFLIGCATICIVSAIWLIKIAHWFKSIHQQPITRANQAIIS
ncbi:sterol desaturase family protein [uncultured Microscilla sp.]|uniref:sterol desaturase family protein n=1 Tax=uncultured Microscilla sp. TaxID=432653 RepID=UPI00262BC0DA|nr:sterol desaturase family protein [uncultured Microscilla sp.]